MATTEAVRLPMASEGAESGDECCSSPVILVEELPPAIYMHSFGGSAAMVNSLLAIEKKAQQKQNKKRKRKGEGLISGESPIFYFGFSHAVNSRSHKTPEVIAAVPDDRLLLESDLETSSWDGGGEGRGERGGLSRREEHLEAMAECIARAKGWTAAETRARTCENAERFFGAQSLIL